MVDDNNFILTVVQDSLTERGHEVHILENPESVYDTVRKVKPELLILDIMMPGVDGIEICRNIKSSPDMNDAVILIHSAKRDTDLMDLCYEAGASAYHIKSGDIASLAKTVDRLISEKFS